VESLGAHFLIFVTFLLDPTGEIRENTMIGLCALRPEGPARFCLARLAGRRISRVIIMNDKTLDRIHKLGPVAITVLAVLALASAWGRLAMAVDRPGAHAGCDRCRSKAMAADIRTIREGLAAIHAASLPNEERITDLRGRVRDPENRPRRMMPLSSSAPDRVGGGP
jgi:hypothetical protein